MAYSKPQVTIDLEEYEHLKRRSREQLNIQVLSVGDAIALSRFGAPTIDSKIYEVTQVTNGDTVEYVLSGREGNMILTLQKRT
jgi:hypothetical protein